MLKQPQNNDRMFSTLDELDLCSALNKETVNMFSHQGNMPEVRMGSERNKPASKNSKSQSEEATDSSCLESEDSSTLEPSQAVSPAGGKKNPPPGIPLSDGGTMAQEGQPDRIQYKQQLRWLQVMDDASLSRSTIVVALLALARAMGEEDQTAITLKDLSEQVRVTPRAVSSALLTAEAAGYIIIRPHAAVVHGENNTTTTNVYEATTKWLGRTKPK